MAQPAQVTRSRLNDIKFPLPPLFEGKREQVKRWQTSVRSFLDAHDRANLPDEFQVLFALSRVSDEGAVGVWKENWLNAHTGGANPGYGTLAQFFLEFAGAFTATTSTQEAMRKIKALKMGGRSTDEHTAQFELLVDQAGLATAGDGILIDFYRSSLAPWLIERIYQGEVPTTLADWKTRAILLDHNRRLASSFTGSGRPYQGSGGGKKKKTFTFRRYPQQTASNQRDPDAMDVDRLAVEIQRLNFEDQRRLMEKGLCFTCRKPGHFAANCPDKKVFNQNQNSPKAKKRNHGKGKQSHMKAHNTFMNIRALVSELSDGEMEAFQQMADEEGFDMKEGEEEQDF